MVYDFFFFFFFWGGGGGVTIKGVYFVASIYITAYFTHVDLTIRCHFDGLNASIFLSCTDIAISHLRFLYGLKMDHIQLF